MEVNRLGINAAIQYSKDRKIAGKRTVWLKNNEVVTYFTKNVTLQNKVKSYQLVKVIFLNDIEFKVDVLMDNVLKIDEIDSELNRYDKEYGEEEESFVPKQEVRRKQRFRMKED